MISPPRGGGPAGAGHISIISVDGRPTIASGFDQRGDVRRQRIEAGNVVDVALCWSTGD